MDEFHYVVKFKIFSNHESDIFTIFGPMWIKEREREKRPKLLFTCSVLTSSVGYANTDNNCTS